MKKLVVVVYQTSWKRWGEMGRSESKKVVLDLLNPG
jgi:hypothetical protein